MTRCVNAGVSLLEGLIAAALLAATILPLVDVFRSSGRALEQSLPYHQAVFLGEKCMEESRVAAAEDPFFVSGLGGNELQPGRKAVTNGEHPFFAVLQEGAPPRGRLEPRRDWAIQTEAGPLAEQLATFRLSASLGRSAGPLPATTELAALLAFDWTDGRGREMAYETGTPLHQWVPLSQVESLDASPSGEELGRVLAPEAGKSVETLARERGADAQTLGRLAALGLVAEAAHGLREGGEAELQAERSRPLDGADPAAPARRQLRLSRLHESLAARALALMPAAREAAVALGRELAPGSLGTPEPPAPARRRIVDRVEGLPDFFERHLRLALESWGALSRMAAMPAGWHSAAYAGILRTAKRASIALPGFGHEWLGEFCAALSEHYRGRAPHLSHMYSVEAVRAVEPERHYPLAAAAATLDLVRRWLPMACARVLMYPMALTAP